MKRPFQSPYKQRGIATLLIVLITGIVMTVAATGLVFSVRGAQQKHMMVHATTHSQSGAWAGVEALRRYLYELAKDEEQLRSLKVSSKPLLFDAGSNQISATITDIALPEADSTEAYRITAAIRNENAGARSTAMIKVVYSVSPATDAQSPNNDIGDVVSIHDDLTLKGDIDIKGGDAARFSVDGSATLGNASVTGLKTLRVTEDLSINSNIQVEEVFANGKLLMSGSSSVIKGSALGDVQYATAGRSGAIFTNSNLYITNGSVDNGNALGLIDVSSGSQQGRLTAGLTLAIRNGSTNEANAKGGVSISSWPTVSTINSLERVTCPSKYWTNFKSITAKSTSNCPGTPNVKAPAVASVTLMEPLKPFEIPKPRVDAYELKDSANYVFEAMGSKMSVTVKNINGLKDGLYFIGSYDYQNNRGWRDFLCDSVDSSNKCLTPSQPSSSLRTICQGFSQSNSCFSFNRTTDTWSISGKNLAPGVMWFKGNLLLANGNYYNTFVATGTAATAGGTKATAVNYAGYNTTCRNMYPVNKTADFEGLYPTNFCDQNTASLTPSSLGNIVLLAGGFINGEFSGGNIELGASTEVWGSVISGNLLLTGGSTIIHGYVVAAGQGVPAANTWGGSTTIDLRDLPMGFDPAVIPRMDGTCNTCGAQLPSKQPTSDVQWALYM